MSIFNSLGSNYNAAFALKTLFAGNKKFHHSELISIIENKYSGTALLFYKGREAIEASLKVLGLPAGSYVAINGFTCYAVVKAIGDAGCKVAYMDIDSSLNFSANTLLKKLESNSKIKVVIIQNTLGYPCDIKEIQKICTHEKIVLIEDLAHSVGTRYTNGKEAGTVGDITVLSFSQDKIIDGISGGAVIVRNKEYKDIIKNDFANIETHQQLRDRFYPFFTLLIRKTYPLKVGKVLHRIVKNLNFLSQPMGEMKGKMHILAPWYCQLIKFQFGVLDKNIDHRRKISSVYQKNLPADVLISELVGEIDSSSNLRFPIVIDDRIGLINFLKKNGVYVSDIWYDSPIAPKRYLNLANYKGECPTAEKISDRILNLPTHINVSLQDAERMSGVIKKWLRSQ